MDFRTLTVNNYSDIATKYPEFMGLGIIKDACDAYSVIFPGRPAVHQSMLTLNPNQLAYLQDLTNCTLKLIRDTPILPIRTETDKMRQQLQLQNTQMSDLPHMLRWVVASIISEHDASLAGKYNRRVAKKQWEPNDQTEYIPTQANIQRQEHAEKKPNAIMPAPPQQRITACRRWFNNEYGIYPEALPAACIFYILDYIMTTRDISKEGWGILITTIHKLAEMATYNTRKKTRCQ